LKSETWSFHYFLYKPLPESSFTIFSQRKVEITIPRCWKLDITKFLLIFHRRGFVISNLHHLTFDFSSSIFDFLTIVVSLYRIFVISLFRAMCVSRWPLYTMSLPNTNIMMKRHRHYYFFVIVLLVKILTYIVMHCYDLCAHVRQKG
jgi:hypothetical protein